MSTASGAKDVKTRPTKRRGACKPFLFGAWEPRRLGPQNTDELEAGQPSEGLQVVSAPEGREAVLGRYTPSHVPGVNMTLLGGNNFILQLKVFLQVSDIMCGTQSKITQNQTNRNNRHWKQTHGGSEVGVIKVTMLHMLKYIKDKRQF